MTGLENALSYHLFEGDFGEPADRVLSDKIVRAAKPHVCVHCRGPIQTGEYHRHHVGVYGGPTPMHYRYCNGCCVTMIEEREDGLCEAMNARFNAGAVAVIGKSVKEPTNAN